MTCILSEYILYLKRHLFKRKEKQKYGKDVRKSGLRGGGTRRLSFFPIAFCEREQLGEQIELTTAGESLLQVKKTVFVILNLFQDLKRRLRKCTSLSRERVEKEIFANPKLTHLREKQAEFTLVKKSKVCHNSDMIHLNNNFDLRFTPHPSLKKKAAFTLAEVLITLGIIGVVAAMTIPAIISKYQHKALESAFKKSYSNLMQAMVYAEPELISDITGSGVVTGDSEFYNKLWERYKIIEDLTAHNKFNMVNVYSQGVKTYNKKADADTACPQLPNLVVSDGSSVGGMFNCAGNWVVIDTNGPYKKPNAVGHDIFYFAVDSKTKRLFPLGSSIVSGYWNFSNQEQYCSIDSSNARNGYACTAFALSNKCPDDESKTYWECLP